ncbi:hypothetical protein Pmar_PMAR001183 [Perkinsus marinus ATCC 50983]|uniref:Uncharacterized protein n=1 Tax=Perkinsus marinus (strain ATCC 50983 / TXsc) TaxID=423536 RepID=C5KT34_PERM5|nr:hypothetical protein Pmar_PMAR001183 [Perkinsus marinus ATCC 50983]XP_002780590.1 hypothetical protein Pmar_PMAR001183 [Perkinsus marinus ATCC 50983]EER12384.1 hypothetical protein Pmar_PMAR001183 [Perkinsus marinus ATCC 50983]EER12385.1 hypothetical protein Pmar_PMAR001183 [Perkinsus marinus ATCC 50983]|eukprot:XP_002780589.1 hypothetical protein Pmar_PMAR001183 [Perkinsus marinus ATCC 50983]
MRIMILLVLTCGFASLVEGSVRLRPAAASPVSYPAGCTGAHKPASEPFCAVGTMDLSDVFKLNITFYIFDVDDPTKSVYFHIELATNGTEPAGLNITGGGSAKVVEKEELWGAVVFAVTISADTVGDGRGKYDPATGRWTADIEVHADAQADIFGEDAIDLPISKVVTVHNGPNYDIGFDALFKETTGDSDDAGISIAFDLSLNTKTGDLFTWELVGEGQLHIWLDPLIDLTPTVEVVKKEFKLPI